MSLRSLSVCLLTAVLAAPAFSQPEPAAAPTSAPATTQSAVPTDQTTPRGALKVLTVAMNKGDVTGIKSVFAPSNALETKMVNAVLDQQAAMMKFHDAAVQAFGADEAKKLPPGDVDEAVSESLVALDKFPEQIDGDTATVGEGQQLLHLKKVDGKWTLPVSMLAPQITNENVDQQLGAMGEQSKVLTDMTTEIGQGKYKSADEAGKALQLKALQQMMQHAATQPTTGPAGAAPVPQSAPPMPQ